MRRFGIALGVSTLLVLLAGCMEAPSERMMGPPTEPPAPSAALIQVAPISITDLGTLGGTTSVASGINDAGEIVGRSRNASGVRRAVHWGPDGTITDLGTLGGADSRAFAINDQGVIVGQARTATGVLHAVRWLPDGTVTDLGTLGGPNGAASDINEAGQIAGSANTLTGALHGVFLGARRYADGYWHAAWPKERRPCDKRPRRRDGLERRGCGVVLRQPCHHMVGGRRPERLGHAQRGCQ